MQITSTKKNTSKIAKSKFLLNYVRDSFLILKYRKITMTKYGITYRSSL